MDLQEDNATSFVTTRTRPGQSQQPSFSPSPIRGHTSSKMEMVESEDFVRERPFTMMSPEPKRCKKVDIVASPKAAPSVLSYPTVIPIPSAKTIGTLYEAALADASPTPVSPSTPTSNPSNNVKNDQLFLKVAGLLSFEQVLLPALGLEEERAIKRIQAKVQRDAPEYKFVMEQCRRLARNSVANAIIAVAANREMRAQQQAERRKMQSLQMQQAREARKKELTEAHKRQVREQKNLLKVARLEERNRIKQKLAKNQKLWKEVVFLTSSISQLEKEEQLWVQTEKDLTILEGTPVKDDSNKEISSPIVLTVTEHSLHKEAERKAKDIVMASDRIQKGLTMVLQLLKESEDVRNELYNKYRKDHLFQGYQSIDDPKGVIRFLSQSSHDDGLF
ncbi:hypothetical protein IV203_037928 [Nitzschia inconspicua]|uniref:Uncharacterized protein n=1 Tax=Nitzschia inconspicua TaxID=303405 RepID=A0A9K3LQF0_9STRA|nr:hypothetical protein IV203_037928 [Nitzschia inconspicua]